MIANVMLFLGVSVAVLAILDLLISEKQKKALEKAVVVLWSYIDDWRHMNYLRPVSRIRREETALACLCNHGDNVLHTGDSGGKDRGECHFDIMSGRNPGRVSHLVRTATPCLAVEVRR
jgi:hypothetical protein